MLRDPYFVEAFNHIEILATHIQKENETDREICLK